VEPTAQDQFLGDARAHPVKFRSSVGCFAKQDDTCIAYPVQQRVDVDLIDVIDRLGTFRR
jgi:hypothetical protein